MHVAMRPEGAHTPPSGIVLQLKDQRTILFPDNEWRLGWDGVHGTIVNTDALGIQTERDTTVSYSDISSAAPAEGRGNTMSQFLLTILGVILVIGLAAIILYAAFRATDW